MTATDAFSAADRPASTGSETIWAIVDVSLLFLTLTASSDMLTQLGPVQSVVWLMCYAITLLRIATLWSRYGALLLRNKVILAYPLVSVASVLWSKAPSDTLVSSIQLTMTFLIAIYLGWRYSLSVILRAIFMVFLLAVVLSLLHWGTGIFPWPVFSRVGGLVGIFTQKNMLGQRSLFAAVIIVAIWLMPQREAAAPQKALALGALILILLAMLLSKSMTSVLLLLPLTGLLSVICIRRIPPAISTVLIVITLVCIAIGPVMLSINGIDPIDGVLSAVGKDATLTGRTELWAAAQHVRTEYPVLGVGFAAFSKAPEFANMRMLLVEVGALTSVAFHNFVLEILVGTGLPGAFAMAVLLATAASRLLFLSLRARSVAASCGLVLLVGIVLTSFLGPSLYRAHEFMIMLVVMFTVSAQEDRLRLLRDAQR